MGPRWGQRRRCLASLTPALSRRERGQAAGGFLGALMRAAIVGIGGPALDPAEAALFRGLPPAGVILFARNVADPVQLNALTASLHGMGSVVLVDQEGGRVARLRPPHWRAHPSAGDIGALPSQAARRAAWLTGALIGVDCREAGIDVVCAPVLDLLVPGADGVVGDRAFGSDPDIVGNLAAALADGLLAAGVLPVGKHAPGHGRAGADSHATMPWLSAGSEDDLAPFIRCAHLPWMMTAHILFEAWDPALPATLSPTIIREVIRGRIGFRGLLVSDDLAMGALTGSPAERGLAALAARCDLAMHCSGALDDSADLLAAAPLLADDARAKLAMRPLPQPLDCPALAAERAELLA